MKLRRWLLVLIAGLLLIAALVYAFRGPLSLALVKRVVALSPEKLKDIPCVMIASGGKTKVPGLRGVLKGGMCDVIITDEQTAQSILAMETK